MAGEPGKAPGRARRRRRLVLLLGLVSTAILLGSWHGPSEAFSPGSSSASSNVAQPRASSSSLQVVPTPARIVGGTDVVQVETADFTIAGDVADLVPDAVRAIRLTLTNSHDLPLHVTRLTVSVSADSTPSGCSSASNLLVIQSNASGVDPILVPARGSVTLASAPRAPQITLLNLPNVNQDVCQNKSFVLTYTGIARW